MKAELSNFLIMGKRRISTQMRLLAPDFLD